MKLNNKGFGLVEGLLIALLLVVLGFGGYYVWSENQEEVEQNSAIPQQSTQSSEESETASSVHSNQEIGLSVELPEGWQASDYDNRTEGETYLDYGFTLSNGSSEIAISTSVLALLQSKLADQAGIVWLRKISASIEVKIRIFLFSHAFVSS